jgi:RNA-directed DNA polymerase
MEKPLGALERFGQLQRCAGVDGEVEELVRAFARLEVEAGREVVFYDEKAARTNLSERARDFLCGWLVEKNPGLDGRVWDFLVRYSRAMASHGLPVIFSVRHLARKWRMSEARLRWLARNAEVHCQVFRIPKKDGGERLIVAPVGKLRTLQGWILRHILEKARSHEAAQGFVKGRSIVDNATQHVGKQVVVRLDLRDFFPSITFRQVRKIFERLGYPYRVATILGNLCTYRGRLPQGAPTSPALSNLVCWRLDRRLSGLGGYHGFTYTRYADDLVFSSDNKNLPKLIPFIRQVLKEEGFELNEEKVRVMWASQRQVVTGLVVNRHVNLLRERRRLLRAALHRARVKGAEAVEWPEPTSGDPLRVVHGHLAFWQMVEPVAGQDSRKRFASLCARRFYTDLCARTGRAAGTLMREDS